MPLAIRKNSKGNAEYARKKKERVCCRINRRGSTGEEIDVGKHVADGNEEQPAEGLDEWTFHAVLSLFTEEKFSWALNSRSCVRQLIPNAPEIQSLT